MVGISGFLEWLELVVFLEALEACIHTGAG